jgi:large subunit ribosomal protein L13
MKTTSVTPTDIKKQWVLIDATNQPVGRVAAEVARLLRGKHKANYVPHLDCGDNVIIVNAAKAIFTGRKLEKKFYYHHSSYIGGIKATAAKDLMANKPERVFEHAVRGMLPHNKLGRKVFHNVKIYAGAEHPHEAQKPVAAPLRLAKEG